ncbi:YaiO family outer membrane beta-barrel protein [Flavobacterium enshiense]|uniref:YaiO family outer membrane beta-barrel protein n=1 Tax=Flavobacterium enshiense TaxID=1341165 RepID=UPI00345D5BD2
MKKLQLIILTCFFLSISLNAQKIDTDNLLKEASNEFNNKKDAQKAIPLAHIGIKEAPDYLDFHLLLGRIHWQQKAIDSARYYFNHVIAKNPKYKDAFLHLSKLELEQKNTSNANTVIDKGIAFYPDEKEFYLLKADAVRLNNNDEETIAYLTQLAEKFPEDQRFQNEITELKLKTTSDRIGINYNYTTFSRDGVGPWHLVGLQYIRERKKLTVIGRINYADRRYFGESTNSGLQYEFETYFTNGKKSYSFTNIAVGDKTVFPEFRFAYSYFHTLGKEWEGDLGFRYTKTPDEDLYAGVLGIGKYVGSYWFNLKSYWQWEDKKMYPAFTATARYYFDTKYDYATLIAGYGTSPDERVTLGQFQQRVALNSYRIGVGYYRLLGEHYCIGLQGMYNRQEYMPEAFQDEFDLFITMQYKF